MPPNTHTPNDTPTQPPPQQDPNIQTQPTPQSPATQSPPTYTTTSPPPPPQYPTPTRLATHLSTGPPDETISVPMILSTETKRKRDLFLPFGRQRGSVTQTVIVRKMTRRTYMEHYARDSEGNYVGTGKRAVDAGLVFIPGKSTPEDLLRQVEEVAFGKQHHQGDFANGWAITQGGGGAF